MTQHQFVTAVSSVFFRGEDVYGELLTSCESKVLLELLGWIGVALRTFKLLLRYRDISVTDFWINILDNAESSTLY